MFKHVKDIVKKELTRIFKDRRMLSALILPGVLIYLLYTGMGWFFTNSYTVDENTVFICQVQNMPASMEPIFDLPNFDTAMVTDTDSAMTLVADNSCDLLVVFPENFDEQIASGSTVPNIRVHYNSSSTASNAAYEIFTTAVQEFEDSLVNVLDINKGISDADLASDTDIFATIFSGIMPMLVLMMLFPACLGSATDSIAGEKERGTIATLLVTPVNRSSIALGKVISLSISAIFSGTISFIAIMMSVPSLMGPITEQFGFSTYGFSDYAGLFFVIISTILLIVSIICIISVTSKSVKEATGKATPLTLIASVTAMLTTLSDSLSSPAFRFIPIFNSALCLNDIFSFSWSASDIAITCVSNLAYTIGFIFVLSKMFNSEKIMFSK